MVRLRVQYQARGQHDFLRGRGDRVWQPNANWMGVAFQVCKQLLQTLTMMQGLSIL